MLLADSATSNQAMKMPRLVLFALPVTVSGHGEMKRVVEKQEWLGYCDGTEKQLEMTSYQSDLFQFAALREQLPSYFTKRTSHRFFGMVRLAQTSNFKA